MGHSEVTQADGETHAGWAPTVFAPVFVPLMSLDPQIYLDILSVTK